MMTPLRKGEFQRRIFSSDLRVFDEVISEKEAVPVLKVSFNHMDVMGPFSIISPFDEPSIVRRHVIPPGGPPEIVVSLVFQHRGYTASGFI
jgi:hypothetical protein